MVVDADCNNLGRTCLVEMRTGGAKGTERRFKWTELQSVAEYHRTKAAIMQQRKRRAVSARERGLQRKASGLQLQPPQPGPAVFCLCLSVCLSVRRSFRLSD